MKTISLALLICAITFISNKSEAQSFNLEDNVVNATVGFGNGSVGGSFGFAFGLSGERCFFDDLINGDFSVGIGGYFGLSSTKDEFSDYLDNYSYKYTTIALAGRGSFHWTGVENLDTYAGIHLGGAMVSSKFDGHKTDGVSYPSAETGGILVAPFVGARYYFNETISFVGEMGGGLGYLNAGVGFKF